MKQINVAEILKNCPNGMELYSPMYGLGTLTKVTDRIHVKFPKEHNVKCFRPDGKVSEDGEIMLYPKGKTTWEGFQRPFCDGDIVVFDTPHGDNLQLFIFKNKKENDKLSSCYLMLDGDELDLEEGMYYITRLATEDEEQKLFKAIKDNGYKWNAETKTLDRLIEPKFKVGDRIKNKNSGICDKVIEIFEDCYLVESCFDEQSTIDFDIQDNWELVHDKFDINTLVPFKSAVLIRNDKTQKWIPAFWGYKANNEHYVTTFGTCRYCIPYEGNENLLTTNNDCDDYFKTWE